MGNHFIHRNAGGNRDLHKDGHGCAVWTDRRSAGRVVHDYGREKRPDVGIAATLAFDPVKPLLVKPVLRAALIFPKVYAAIVT